MKHLSILLSCILLFNCENITATTYDNDEYIVTHENGEKSFTLYAQYFLIKEFCKAILHAPFIDHNKMKQASICCCKAHHRNYAPRLWANLFFKFDESLTNELKNHIYNDSTKELTSFILQKYQELELDCRECGKYSDYYIPEQSTPQN